MRPSGGGGVSNSQGECGARGTVSREENGAGQVEVYRDFLCVDDCMFYVLSY